ncbi:MAG TPA: hypothetical protein ENJ77_01745, partial [Candidatus Moranbacteria bacterium]|nr:hypothetical protein [Candidatus Moranbacteria bacterium]
VRKIDLFWQKNAPTTTATLLAAAPLLSLFLIYLANASVLPFSSPSWAAFWYALVFLSALYRPRWVFWFFAALLPLQTVNVAPVDFPWQIKPYQLFSAALALSLLWRAFFVGKTVSLPKWKLPDSAAAVFFLSAAATTFLSVDWPTARKQIAILFSFWLCYLLVRYFIRSPRSAGEALRFFLVGSWPISLYAVWQNWRFAHGLPHYEVMPGRPQATFAEPNWLGMYLATVLVLAAATAIFRFLSRRKKSVSRLELWGLCLIAFSASTALLLTASRAAWLGALAGAVLIVAAAVWKDSFRGGLRAGVFFLSLPIFSYLAIKAGSLTAFDLLQRAESVGGRQEITVACANKAAAGALREYLSAREGEKLSSVDELTSFACEHIRLEEIEEKRSAGREVITVYRDDPSSEVRRDLYHRSRQLIAERPFFGIGFGREAEVFGRDDSGRAHNAGNLFLQVWLGGGLIALAALTAFLGLLLFRLFSRLAISRRRENIVFSAALLAAAVALLVSNLFNAGLFF